MQDRDAAFADYFASRSSTMRGTAYLLCGDWHRAEDLVQTAFVKLYRAWHRIAGHETLDAYTRQILVRTFLDESRRGFFHRERPTAEHDDRSEPVAGSVEDRMVLLGALADVAPRQRAALVLRYWEDMSVEDTAKALKCTAGTVKSQTARGLDALRHLVPTSTF
ncbi:SigE family RNA polymerase sigma factor [Actinophytocola gossypii]|uniref:SigE family RNA polymerase sigma factor n=1 Tax=Actinophytocola gossypii TaxID=2812003 RepID=A0ABT2JI97_9PSEU|nr:SigE family RNA polymerase sigma factor [Actinophytocola gossypii]MCT2587506.1 SigE family RNA polymerase sigma factor [Actinophytocola gossypii]